MSTSTETPVPPVSQLSAPNGSMAGANGVTFAYRRSAAPTGRRCDQSFAPITLDIDLIEVERVQ